MMNSLEGLFTLPFLLLFAYLGWVFWEFIFWLISLIPLKIILS